MDKQLHKRSIIHKTIRFGLWTFLSRILGAIREILQIRFLGVGELSDVFIMAFRIPNSLRKIFAEGALSSAFVPVFIKIAHTEDKKSGNQLMTTAFLFFETIVLLLCCLVWLAPEQVLWLVASGFSTDQMQLAIQLVRILFPLIFFISSSALLSGALQAENHFFMPAFAPVLLNLFFIGSLALCLYKGYSLSFLAGGILTGGFVQLLLYITMYFKLGYSFSFPTLQSLKHFKSILTKFVNCLFGVSIMELNLLLDGNIATKVLVGGASVLYFSARFMQIPLGVFAVAFSTVMLSYFSRVLLYAPKRLSFLFLEVVKCITWAITPAMLFLMFTSHKLFSTLIMSKNVSADYIWRSQWILIIFCAGLIFFSLNKLITNIFYAFGDTWTPTKAGAWSTLLNIIGNCLSYWLLKGDAALYGIAFSTTLSGILNTGISSFYLYKNYELRFPIKRWNIFFRNYLKQITTSTILFLCLHELFFVLMRSTSHYYFFSQTWGYWMFVSPLALCIGLFLYFSREYFKINLYFLS